MSVELVIARYNEDISWLIPFFGIFKIYIYNKGRHLTSLEYIDIINIPNIGREAHTYLYHIHKNYNSLSDIVVFLQADISEHTEGKNPYTFIYKLIDEAEIFSYSLNYEILPKQNEVVYPDFNILMYKKKKLISCECNFKEFFEVYFQKYPDLNFNFYKGAIFAYTQDKIKKRSKYFYKTLLNLEHRQNGELAHFLERSWFYI